jgi:hypothetical protein
MWADARVHNGSLAPGGKTTQHRSGTSIQASLSLSALAPGVVYPVHVSFLFRILITSSTTHE